MSPKITQTQLDANKATAYALDDYRKMVNYVSGTNKGYVRFSLGQDGKLKLEKFNNKVDVPLSWRSNTGGASLSVDGTRAKLERRVPLTELGRGEGSRVLAPFLATAGRWRGIIAGETGERD